MKILVVDDEKLLVKGIKFNLENEGYQVECAYDGAAAVELARTGGFDLIILDLMMPSLDGLSVIRRLRATGKNVPILVLSAKSEVDDKVQALAIKNGAAAFAISGAGPTLLCLHDRADFAVQMEKDVRALKNHWRVMELCVDTQGVCIEGE